MSDSTGEPLDDFRAAYTSQFPYTDENIASLSWYARRMIESLKRQAVKSLLSLGVGHQVVACSVLSQLVPELDQYTIVEGAPGIIENFVKEVRLPDHVDLVCAYFEDFQPDRTFDAIEMGFVLEHVQDPHGIVGRFRDFLAPDGLLCVAVPNATSLHRRIGHAAGLLADMYQLSEYDRQLGHRRFFDVDQITKLLTDEGFRVTKSEGILLKPITTNQLQQLQLSERVMEGLFQVGVNYPHLCNAVYMEAQMDNVEA